MNSASSSHSPETSAAPLGWTLEADRVTLGDRLSLAFHRTLRVPEDDQDYPLPPGLGRLPVHRVEDFTDRVPSWWRRHDAVFVPLFQREALWLGFDGRWWHPNAVTVAAGGVNVITGGPANEGLSPEPQDYLVVPDQPWLDGFHLQAGVVRQFVAAPLGWSVTVAEQLGSVDQSALWFRVFDAVPGRFPEHAPPESDRIMEGAPMALPGGLEMGFAAGGRIVQRLYADRHGFESWRPEPVADVIAYVVNSEAYEGITGQAAPPTPISAEDYTKAGLPWFKLYDEAGSLVAASNWLHRIKTLGQIDPGAVTTPFSIDPAQVRRTDPT
jgi:hypothetical protein